MQSSNSTHKVFAAVAKAIDVLGEGGTINVLQDASKNNTKNKHIDFVIQMVCSKFRLTPEQILLRTKKINHITALQYICYYCHVIAEDPIVKGLKRNDCLRFYDVGLKIKRSGDLASKYYLKIAKKKKDKKDATHQDYFKHFDEIVKKYLKEIK